MRSLISVYVTFASSSEARKVAKALLQKKLIACVNIFPAESMFWWNGKINSKKEAAALMKARGQNFSKIETEIKKMHSYEVPCIVAFECKKNSNDFAEWVNKNV